MTPWTLWDVQEMCIKIEAICPDYGCHVALTGGLLYKTGERKDADIIFYRIRQVKKIDTDGLWKALEKIGFNKLSGFGWCFKATYEGKNVDCLFPEEQAGGESFSTFWPMPARPALERNDETYF